MEVFHGPYLLIYCWSKIKNEGNNYTNLNNCHLNSYFVAMRISASVEIFCSCKGYVLRG